MIKSSLRRILPLIAVVVAGSAFAGDGAGKDDAVGMVKKAAAFIKAQGPEKAYAEISNKAGQFIDRDLYVVVYQLDGKVLAHGSNQKFVGKDMIDAQDVDVVSVTVARPSLDDVYLRHTGRAFAEADEQGAKR